MPVTLEEIQRSLEVITMICDLVERATDIKRFCLLVVVGCLVYWFIHSTPEVPQGPTTPQRRQQLREWLQQEEFITVISGAMNQAAQNVASERNTPAANPVTPVRRRR